MASISGVSGLAGIGGDYLSMLISQLQYQDPFNPVSNTDFFSQMAELGSMNQLTQLNGNLQSIAGFIQIVNSSSLIGKKVDVTNPLTGAVTTGTVKSVVLEDGFPKIVVGTRTFEIENITRIY